MKTYAFCPISEKKTNEQVARINAYFTVLLLLVFGLSQNILPIFILAIDFFLRASDHAQISPIAFISKHLSQQLQLNQSYTNAGPKLFAARIGFAISCLIAVSFVFGFQLTAFVLTGILGLFSLLEATLGICVACKIYPVVYRFLYKKQD
jgi:hypothetical protein